MTASVVTFAVPALSTQLRRPRRPFSLVCPLGKRQQKKLDKSRARFTPH
jgi:hypothetical protein